MRTGLRAFATAKIVCKIEDRTLAESGNVSITQYMYVDFAVAPQRHENIKETAVHGFLRFSHACGTRVEFYSKKVIAFQRTRM